MKRLKLSINKDGLILNEEDKSKSPQKLCADVALNIILSYGAQNKGLQEDERKKFYKISDCFDKAIESNLEEVELEDDWMGFLKKCVRECRLMPNTLLRRVEEAILSKEN